jgi:hypothetical protein
LVDVFVDPEAGLVLVEAFLCGDPLPLALPGTNGFQVSLGAVGELEIETALIFDSGGARIVLVSAPLFVRFPPGGALTPVVKQDHEWVADLETDGSPKGIVLAFTGIDLELGSDGKLDVTSNLKLDLQPVQIGGSGVVVEMKGLGLALSDGAMLPPGVPVGSRGCTIDSLIVHLPPSVQGAFVPGEISASDLFLGTGGFTGKLWASWASGKPIAFAGLQCTLKSLMLEFRQNSLVASRLECELVLPFFDKALQVEIGLSDDGDFTVGLGATSGGLASLVITDVLTLELDSLKFTVDDGLLTVRLSGMIIPTFGELDVPPIRVDNLTIDSKGNVDLPGGWLALPKQYGLDLHGFKISITRFGLGREPDGRKWIGFSGGVKLVDGLPNGVSVDGLRITCNEHWGDAKLSLRGVGVELSIKDVLYFKGAVAFQNDPANRRFDGSIKLELKSLKFNIDGQFVVGDTSYYRYMALYVAVDLPVGLPILSTGLAVFGMEGLFARRMAPNKLPTENWYEIGNGGWYKKVKTGVLPLTDPNKWAAKPDATALGIGLTFGTLSDNGHTLSARALFLGVFPGPILMIDGAANLLKDRSKLGEDPLFRTLAVYDGKAGSLLVGLDIAYKYEQATGKLIKLSAGTEAYYEFANPMAWRINLGLRTPKEQRIQARIFSMFDANAYLMLNARQVAMGCWVGYDHTWKFGPLKVALSAWMESNVVVSFKPIQFYGDMALHGGVELSAFGFGFSLTVDARVEAEVFHPRHLLAQLDVTLNLPAPLPKKKRRLTAHLTIEFGPTPDAPPIPLALKSVSIEHMKVSTTWPLPAPLPHALLQPDYDDGQGFLTSSPSGDMDALPATIPVVPMDCLQTIHFNRDVHDDALIGAIVQIPDPESEWIGDPDKRQGSARVRYELSWVVLDKWTGSSWTEVAGKGVGVSGLPELFGSWTPAAAASGPGVAQNRLTVSSLCGFTSFRHTGSEYADWFADHFGGPQGYPCIPAPGRTEICLDFLKLPNGPVDVPFHHPDHPDVTFVCPPPGGLTIRDVTPVAGDRALCSTVGQGIDIIFANGADHVVVRDVHYGDLAAATVTASDSDGTALAPLSTIDGGIFHERIPVQTTRVHPDRVSRVHLGEASRICVAEVCAILGPGPVQLAAASQALERNQDAIGLWSRTGAVLEPHTIYRLRIATRIEVDEFKYDDQGTVNVDHDLVQAAFFRTEGPPGLAKLSQPLAPDGASTETGLEDLTLYVEQTIPPTVPARGEAPPLPRPVYRAYDVAVAFNEDYVDLMYRLAGRDLALMLYDRNNLPVRGRNGGVAVAQNPWGATETAGLSELETSWLAMIAANQCVPDVDETQIPKNLTLTAPAEILAPDALYQARLMPLLLHEDFGRIVSGTGRWQPLDFSPRGGASAWSIGHTTVPVAANLTQTAMTGGDQNGVDALGTAAFLTADLRAPVDEDPAQWTDYRLACGLRAEGGAAIGLAFRWLSPQDFYLFAMDERTGQGRKLYRVNGGVLTTLAQDPELFAHQTNYEVVIEAIGDSIKIWVDGGIVFDVVDPNPITAGTIALHSSGAVAATFSDVKVHDLSKAAKSAYGFSFTTSRFVNFLHQVQSHDDDAWPGMCTLSAPDLAVATSQAVANVGVPHSDEEARAFDVIADDILGPRARQEPVRTETYRISSATGDVIALLVRSPEPFDHSRLSLTLSNVSRDAPRSIAPAKVKLIAASLGAAQPADEQVTLLVREATDLTGWKLQLRDPGVMDPLHLDDPSLSWETIFEFGPEIAMADGTLVRIHSGDPLSGPAGTLRRVERYRAAPGSGNLKLSHDRVDLRLVRPDGRIEHARCFIKDALYAPIGSRYLRKADGTAFILLPAGGGDFPPGALRLEMTYRRDNRASVADSLVLAEAGDTSAESTSVDVPTDGPISPPSATE